MTISRNFERFQYYNFETDFLENENLKKLVYRLLVENTKIENASLPYKTAISEANFNTLELWAQNGPITRRWVLPVAILFFKKFCFSSRTYKELIWFNNNPNAHITTFCKR